MYVTGGWFCHFTDLAIKIWKQYKYKIIIVIDNTDIYCVIFYYLGMSMRSRKNFSKDQVQILPFTLIPSSFPEKPFFTVKSVQALLNELIHKVAYDKEFLTNSLKRYCEFIYRNFFITLYLTRHYIYLFQYDSSWSIYSKIVSHLRDSIWRGF